MSLFVATPNNKIGHNYCNSHDIISSLICIINDYMYVQINSCDLGTEGIPRYSWNTAKVGIKHQSINGTRSTHVGMVWINRMALWVYSSYE
jgi:hypothetical protein